MPAHERPFPLRHYLRIALRKIRTRQPYPSLQIVGLVLGLGGFLFMFPWWRSEYGFDRFHENKDRIFLLLSEREGGPTTADSSPRLGPALKERLDEIEAVCRIRFKNASLVGNRFHEQRFFLADASFFSVFSFPFIRGDPAAALADHDSVVLTEEAAERHFGTEDPMGKVLHVRQFNADLRVSGVVRNVPRRTHLRFDLLARLDWLGTERLNSWEPSCSTYLLVRPGIPASALAGRLRKAGRDLGPIGETGALRLHPLARIHRDGWDGGSSFKHTKTFFVISILVLVLACLNALILGAAGFARNARDTGVRKFCGAVRSQVMAQHIVEAILYALLAFLPAVLIVWMGGSLFIHFLGGEAYPPGFSIFLWAAGILGVIPAVGILTGIYPAVGLSSLRPGPALKGEWKGGRGPLRLRKILVGVQFSIAVGLVLSSLIVYRQLRLIRSQGLGFETDSILVLPNRVPYEPFKDKLLEDPGVAGVTAASSRPLQVRDEVLVRRRGPAGETSFRASYAMIDFDFLNTFGIALESGRDFEAGDPADRTRTCLINKSAARALGEPYPLGKTLVFDHPAFAAEFNELTIVGIVKDFQTQSAHQATGPFVFRFHRPWHFFIFVKLKPGAVPETIERIDQVYRTFNSSDPFTIEFLDAGFRDLYRSEIVMGTLLYVFGAAAVAIAAISLFGLASYSAEHRLKEIGIRRIFGASVAGLVVRLSRDLTSFVFLANLAAGPVVYLLMASWLENYARRVRLGPGMFFVAFVCTQTLALLTAGFKTFKTARADPVRALRAE